MGSDHICRGRALKIAVEFTALAILLLAGGAGAATLTVCSSGCAYTSVQAAINAASTGDVIEVQSGTYYENVDVNKQLVLRGIDNGGGKPVVDARGYGNAITLSAGNSVLEGFAIMNATVNAGILVKSNNNTLSNNTASNNRNGIYLSGSNNTLTGNTASNNSYYGISLHYSSSNTLSSNIASNNSWTGISLSYSSSNTLIGNTMFGNSFNFGLVGNSDSHFDQNIDTSNIVDNKPIYYVKNAINQIYDGSTNAGTFYCINCDNITIKGLTLSKSSEGVFLWKTQNSRIENILASNNSYSGIYLYSSNNNTLNGNTMFNNSNGIYLYSSSNNMLSSNTASNNSNGIYLYSSSNNTLNDNNVSNNYFEGISLYSSSNNIVYHNNLINNAKQAYDNYGNNSWDSGYPGGGNFWSDYNGTDANNDGIGDTPYNISGAGAQDRYPFMKQNGWLGAGELRGDVNRNGKLDTGDASLILRSIVGLPIPSQFEPVLPTGDMNCNNKIDTGDATLILRDVVGLPIPRCLPSFEVYAVPSYVDNHT